MVDLPEAIVVRRGMSRDVATTLGFRNRSSEGRIWKPHSLGKRDELTE